MYVSKNALQLGDSNHSQFWFANTRLQMKLSKNAMVKGDVKMAEAEQSLALEYNSIACRLLITELGLKEIEV